MKIKTTFNNILPKEFGKEAKREDIMQEKNLFWIYTL